MTLTIVFDNHSLDPLLKSGWGFAAWLEVGAHTVLFDTGADGRTLMGNLRTLNRDPHALDAVVLSHNHSDHTGGLMAVLAANPQVTVYLPQAFPASFKRQVQSKGASVVEVGGPLEILPGLWSTGVLGTDIAEQALVVKAAQGLIVVTGCAHPGVDRLVARAQEVVGGPVQLVVGGFHLGGASRARVQEIIAAFHRFNVRQVAPCHCTGDAAAAQLCQAFGQECTLGVGWKFQSRIAVWEPSSQGIPAQIGVSAVAVAPSDPRVVYLVAYEPGGVCRSLDGGDSWQAASGGIASLAPMSLAVHPSDPDVAWVGTVTGGYRTVNGGRGWQVMADLPAEPLYALAVAADGQTLYAGGAAAGVWRSGDGGQTWSLGGECGALASILSLEVSPDGTVYAGTAGQGLWFSADGGASWQSGGAELAETYVSGIGVGSQGRLYVLAGGRLYQSVHGRSGWQALGPPGFEALSFGHSAVPTGGGATSSETLYLGGKGDGLAVSYDSGQTWSVHRDEFRFAELADFAVDPNRPQGAFLATRYHGLYRTGDGGATWTLISGSIGKPAVLALAQASDGPGPLFAGTLDGVYRSDDGGAHWRLVSGALGKLFVQVLAVGSGGQVVYAGGPHGVHISQDGGMTWRWAERDTAGIAIFKMVIDRHDADRVYAASWGHNVLRSLDGGQSWAPIHNGLETLSAHAFALDPIDPRVLYAGTVEAIYRSVDGGNSWQISPVSDRPLTTFALVVDPQNPAHIYAGTTTGVYASADRGKTWQPAGADDLSATVTALTLNPDDGRVIWAGTEHHGLWVSVDGGGHWQPLGMEGASVFAILLARDGTVWLGTDQGIFKSP